MDVEDHFSVPKNFSAGDQCVTNLARRHIVIEADILHCGNQIDRDRLSDQLDLCFIGPFAGQGAAVDFVRSPAMAVRLDTLLVVALGRRFPGKDERSCRRKNAR